MRHKRQNLAELSSVEDLVFDQKLQCTLGAFSVLDDRAFTEESRRWACQTRSRHLVTVVLGQLLSFVFVFFHVIVVSDGCRPVPKEFILLWRLCLRKFGIFLLLQQLLVDEVLRQP